MHTHTHILLLHTVYTRGRALRKERGEQRRVALRRAKVIKVSHVPGWRHCRQRPTLGHYFLTAPLQLPLHSPSLSLLPSSSGCVSTHARRWNCGLRPAVKPWLMNEPISSWSLPSAAFIARKRKRERKTIGPSRVEIEKRFPNESGFRDSRFFIGDKSQFLINLDRGNGLRSKGGKFYSHAF